MAKANKGQAGHKIGLGFGLIGCLVLVLCWGGCSVISSIGDSGDSGGKRATSADKQVNQQAAATESPATSTLRNAPSPSGPANGDGTGDGGPADAASATPTPTPPKAAPTKATTKPTPKKTTAKPKPSKTTSKPKPKPSKTNSGSVYYKNCDAVRAAGKAPIRRGQPGYGKHLDRDGDGVGCE